MAKKDRPDPEAGKLSDPTPGGESAERAATGSMKRVPEDRPDIRAARTETRIRRWALVLLVLVPVIWFVVQRLTS